MHGNNGPEIAISSSISRQEQLEHWAANTVGEVEKLSSPIELAEYDQGWPSMFEGEARRIRTALGDTAMLVEHVGSTSVPGLAAKPRIDILLVVPDSTDEARYVSHLKGAGYELRVRETDWHEHRMFRGSSPEVNLHVFSQGCVEIERMLSFRDWLRSNDDDRQLYENAKRELVAREWTYLQDYADAKTEVVELIIGRANASQKRSRPAK